MLGTPVGHPDFVQTWATQRLEEEELLLRQLPKLPDLQCSWLLLLLCASPRANHALRTVPPQEILAYARAHDQAVWQTLKQCLGGAAEPEALHARDLATLQACLGGLGLQSHKPCSVLGGSSKCFAGHPRPSARVCRALSGCAGARRRRGPRSARRCRGPRAPTNRRLGSLPRLARDLARPRQSTLAPATGHMAGSFMRRVLETNISAIV